MRKTTEPTMNAVLSELAGRSHRPVERIRANAAPANDRPAASLSLHPDAGNYELLAARCAGYDVSLRHRHAAGSGNFEKRPKYKNQYGHGARPDGGDAA